MRTCRFRRAGREHFGVFDGASVRALTAEPWAGGLPEGPAHAISEVALLAPVQPSKVVCIGRNYRAHAQELGHEVPREPLLFIKPAEQHFTRATSFDPFCPIGPCIETALDPMDASVVCRVNGAERQRGSTRELVVDAYALVAFVSSVMTLLPGDVVSTGTPAGVGPLRRGDWVEVEVPGIGILKNPVV